jgi:hypothetical protein
MVSAHIVGGAAHYIVFTINILLQIYKGIGLSALKVVAKRCAVSWLSVESFSHERLGHGAEPPRVGFQALATLAEHCVVAQITLVYESLATAVQ